MTPKTDARRGLHLVKAKEPSTAPQPQMDSMIAKGSSSIRNYRRRWTAPFLPCPRMWRRWRW